MKTPLEDAKNSPVHWQHYAHVKAQNKRGLKLRGHWVSQVKYSLGYVLPGLQDIALKSAVLKLLSFANNPLPLLWSTFKRMLFHTLNSSSTAVMKCAECPLHPAPFYIEAFRNVKPIYPHCSNPRMLTFQIKLSSMQLVKITKITSHQCSAACLFAMNPAQVAKRLQWWAAFIPEYSQMSFHYILTLSNKTCKTTFLFQFIIHFIADI